MTQGKKVPSWASETNVDYLSQSWWSLFPVPLIVLGIKTVLDNEKQWVSSEGILGIFLCSYKIFMGGNDASWCSLQKTCTHYAASLRMKSAQIEVILNSSPEVTIPVGHLDSGHGPNVLIVKVHWVRVSFTYIFMHARQSLLWSAPVFQP